MGLFDFLKSKKNKEVSVSKKGSSVKSRSYSTKVLVAWGEAIDGNLEIRDWLMKNGYQELGMFCFAIRNESSAQEWLMKNGYPHLLAVIKSIEGETQARDWLLHNNFEALFHIAAAAEGDTTSKRILLNKDKVYAGLAKKMERIKDQIEWDNNSIHKINP